MKSRPFSLRNLRAALPLFAAALVTHAATPSDPVGALRLRLRASSDTLVSLPLQRPALVEAAVATRTGSQLTLATDVPALPSAGAYVLVMSGALEGAVLPATALSSRTLTLDSGAFDLASLKTETAHGVGQGDLVSLVPYWTLDTVFPSGAGIQVSTSTIAPKTMILCYDETATGTNLPPATTYFYFGGNPSKAAGWYRFGDMSALRGSTRFPPYRYFTVRHPAGSDTELLLTGAVQMAGFRVGVATRQASRDQDNLFALSVPVPTPLGSSQLRQSNAFVGSTSPIAPKDQLLVFDNSAIAQNKPPIATYFYFTGDGGHAAGWYRFGDMSQSADNLLLKPGEGYIIRKAATASAETRFWGGIPSYLQ